MNKLVVLEIIALILIAMSFFGYLSYGGWNTTPTPLVTEFNTSFWNLETVEYPPLNTTLLYIGNMTVGETTIDMYDVFFNSHMFNESTIRIHAVLLRPPGSDLPAVLVLHGTNGSAEDMLPFGLEVASWGYAVFAMDSPGCGNSTGPTSSPENTVNFEDGPYSAYYYQNVLAASRAITVLSTLPFVNASSIAVSGASMGGVATFILSAVDSRVNVSIPIVASGYFDEIAQRGSFANFIVPSSMNITDPDGLALIRYFDCRAYAARLSIPTLMLIGTHDEFFFLDAVNKTYTLIPSNKTLNLAPNHGHSYADGWLNSTNIWLDHYLKGQPQSLPVVSVPTATLINFYTSVKVEVSVSPGNYTTSVLYRNGLPGSLWAEISLDKNETIPLPPLPTTIQYFLAVKANGTTLSTSPVYQIQATSSYFYMIFFALFAFGLLLMINWRSELWAHISSDKVKSMLFTLSIIFWIIAGFSLTLPWIDIPGKTSVSLLQMWDNYAIHLPTISILFVALLAALAGYAIRMWIGGALLLVPAVVIYYYIATFITWSGGAFTFGWGAYLFAVLIGASLLIPAVLKIIRG
ncbi:MAG: acetylxylan esterase [Candidatus Methanomethyliaceae archaeon]|nr:acetylxylan esterase [Candidatus Methanomethyliaceae archaeon]